MDFVKIFNVLLDSPYIILLALRGAIVLITQNFDPAKDWMDKMPLSGLVSKVFLSAGL